MPSKVNILNVGKLRKQIAQAFNAQAIPVIFQRAADRAKQPMLDILLQIFRSTSFYQSVTYDTRVGGLDINAEFGLDPITARAAINDIEDVILNSIDLLNFTGTAQNKFTRLATANSLIVSFRRQNFVNRVRKISQAQYESINSSGASTVVPWLDWLIDGYELPDFGILFDVSNSGRLAQVSRSGRAIMISGQSEFFDPSSVAKDLDAEDQSNFFVALITSDEFNKSAIILLQKLITEELNNFDGTLQ